LLLVGGSLLALEHNVTIEEVVTGYYEYWQHRSDDCFWAVEAVSELCCDLAKGTDVALRLIATAEDNAYLAYVAAGPVEDLIKEYGGAALTLFEEAAETSPRVIEALAGVWLDPSDNGYGEWHRIMQMHSRPKQ